MRGVVDLRSCLESWPYDAARNVRIEHGVNGRDIILVRQPMGLEQYEVDGRPDGRQVNGMETVLDFHQARINGWMQTQAVPIFELTTEECAELFDEANVFYRRLMVLFRVKDWPRAERDAAQILRLLDYVRQHATCAGNRVQLEPWRPHLTRIRAVANAMKLLAEKPCQDVFQKVRATNGILQIFDDGAPDYGVIEEVLLESVRDSLAGLPALHPPKETCFLRQGDYWKIQSGISHLVCNPRTAWVVFVIFCLLPGFARHFSSPPLVFARRGRCFDAIVGSNAIFFRR